jgi:diaminopimelate epimerase
LEFTKLHGAGNDFIICNNINGQIDNLAQTKSEISASLCHRNFGIGADGFICATKSDLINVEVKMEYYNSDGSIAAMCGNGLRCFAKFVFDNGIVDKNSFSVETLDGIKDVKISYQMGIQCDVELNMGHWSQEIEVNHFEINNLKIDVYSTDFCVPHAMIMLDTYKFDNLSEKEKFILDIGEIIGKNTEYPQGINVNFVEILSNGLISVSTFERGAGKTLACGTGACASHLMANKLFDVNNISIIEMPGGKVRTQIKEDGTIILAGEAVTICSGSTNLF